MMIILGIEERTGRRDFGCDLPASRLLQSLAIGLCDLARCLQRIIIFCIDCRTILGAEIIPLAIALCGIMFLEEHLQQL